MIIKYTLYFKTYTQNLSRLVGHFHVLHFSAPYSNAVLANE